MVLWGGTIGFQLRGMIWIGDGNTAMNPVIRKCSTSSPWWKSYISRKESLCTLIFTAIPEKKAHFSMAVVGPRMDNTMAMKNRTWPNPNSFLSWCQNSIQTLSTITVLSICPKTSKVQLESQCSSNCISITFTLWSQVSVTMQMEGKTILRMTSWIWESPYLKESASISMINICQVPGRQPWVKV